MPLGELYSHTICLLTIAFVMDELLNFKHCNADATVVLFLIHLMRGNS